MPKKMLFAPAAVAIALATAITFGGGAKAAEQETIPWEQLDLWEVRVDRTLGNQCYMAAYYPGAGTILRAGFDSDSLRHGYLLISNPAWASLVEGRVYELIVYFGGHEWLGPAQARRNSLGTLNLVMTFSDFSALGQMGSAEHVMFHFNGQMVANLNLRSSTAAINSLAQCQQAMWRAQGYDTTLRRSDPFIRS